MRLATVVAAMACFIPGATASQAEEKRFDRQSTWKGYAQFHFKVAGRSAYFVAPKVAAPGKPWVWRARFPGYHAEMDVALLGKGFHIAYVDVAGMFGSAEAVKIGDAFYSALTTRHGFAARPALEGVSRGGLFVYNWAVKNSDKVACIYCDTPVCDFKSWPGGQGSGLGSKRAWQQCLKAYGFTSKQAAAYRGNPVDQAARIAEAKIPILHIVSENDRVVPPKENTYLLKTRLAKLGCKLEVISVPKGTAKSNGHHFQHPAPQRVVAFIAKHAAPKKTDRLDILRRAKRIVFLGDSITYAGHYVALFDAWLHAKELGPKTVINVGLPSETVSGLSEKGHAGGRFPRPDLAERLDRILKTTKPDLVFACYGINCGIYQPFDQARFRKYQQGIQSLKRKVEAASARLIVITPPSYDDKRAKKAFSYNGVLDRYAKWLVAQRKTGWQVIDLHTAMSAELAARRAKMPGFTFQPDAVHPNSAGHWYIATQLIGWFGDSGAAKSPSAVEFLSATGITGDSLKLVQQRMRLLRDAYLTAAGHKRPGIRKGLPLKDAQRKALDLSKQLADSKDKR